MHSIFNVIDALIHMRVFQSISLTWTRQQRIANTCCCDFVGWDPGMFSLNRLYGNAILTEGKDYTFWGKGVSQGHSDAIRRIDGV